MSMESMRGRLVEYQGASWEVVGEGIRVNGEQMVYLRNPESAPVMVPLADVVVVQRADTSSMNLLDAARRLAEECTETEYADDYSGASWVNCRICGAMDSHRPDCPTLALPQIVAALEAAEAFTAVAPDPRQWGHLYQPGGLERQQNAVRALFDAMKPIALPE